MNRYEPGFVGGREAKLRYLDGDYQVVVPGDFVRCSITGVPIPMDLVRYWSVEKQEVYADAETSMKRYLELQGS
ncbi:hypothetical protein FHS85_003987 [Rhodoligotrophos appendicifer]|uniref:DUF2093 domain-containing protein n=1 Tax=Rhodoligotrophos appendicifer TaxID=987056 RepID=UPI0011849BA9|nr:DUF2093 domain-containing protein [Rhodoligotrophos appendicifer]